MENSLIEKRCFTDIPFYCIELEARAFYKIMGMYSLSFDVNFNMITSAFPKKGVLTEKQTHDFVT